MHQNPSSILSYEAFTSSLAAFSKLASSYNKHFTASAVVIEQSHILLVHHRRIGAWLPPGGHIEEQEMPHQAAIREVQEETGINISLIEPVLGENLPITRNADAFFLPSPLCMHAVKAIEKAEIFYHIDLAYLCQTIKPAANTINSLPEIISSDEVHEARWIKLSELDKLPLANNVVEIVALAKARLKLPN